MEICILKFDGSHEAEDALKEVIDAQGDRKPWLYDIGTIARPMIGRVKIGMTFLDGKSNVFREGDIADAAQALGAYSGYYLSLLAGPLANMSMTVNAAARAADVGEEVEERLLHLNEIKKVLPRESSALVFIGSTEACDDVVQAFQSWHPKVIRRNAEEELNKRLEALHRIAVERGTEGATRIARAIEAAESAATPAAH
jgi:uncharacterized membrane protein